MFTRIFPPSARLYINKQEIITRKELRAQSLELLLIKRACAQQQLAQGVPCNPWFLSIYHMSHLSVNSSMEPIIRNNMPNISYVRGRPLSQCLIPQRRQTFIEHTRYCKYVCIKSDGLGMQKNFLCAETPKETVAGTT